MALATMKSRSREAKKKAIGLDPEALVAARSGQLEMAREISRHAVDLARHAGLWEIAAK